MDDGAAVAAGAGAVEADFNGDVAVTGQLRRAARSGKGHFLLCTFKEALQAIEPTGPSLREAYADAVYYKCDCILFPGSACSA